MWDMKPFVVAVLILLWSSSMITSASANPQRTCAEEDEMGGCKRWVVEVSHDGAGRGDNRAERGSSRSQNGPRVCEFEGRVVDCSSGAGTWVDYASAWCRPAVPQPPVEHVVWGGRTDGVVHECVRPGFSGIPDPSQVFQRWLSPAQEAVDPLALAWRAVASMNLVAPELGMFPRPVGQDAASMGYVGWNVWLWVADPGPNTWGPISASASDQGYTVTATAEASQVMWEMGNGDVVTCGAGSAWSVQYRNNEASPDCGYVYEQDGHYTVSATVLWEIEWSGPSASGVLELELARSEDVVIAEAQVVNVPVGNR